jgi:predicted nuclease of predicted toxin-antitoxin system
LRKNKYEVDWIYDINMRMSDDEILKLCNKENKILLTNDKVFGELIYNKNYDSKGVILFRGDEERSDSLNLRIESLKELLDFNSNKIYGYFTVITENKIRINKL